MATCVTTLLVLTAPAPEQANLLGQGSSSLCNTLLLTAPAPEQANLLGQGRGRGVAACVTSLVLLTAPAPEQANLLGQGSGNLRNNVISAHNPCP